MFKHFGFALLTFGMMVTAEAQQVKTTKTNNTKSSAQKPPKDILPAVQIYFDFNKSLVKKDEQAKLDKLIEDLKTKTEFNVILTGHTDSTGSDDYNLVLSQKRVDNVFEYLSSKGLDTSVITKSYYGRSKPREKEGKDEEKSKKNRRVEITIVYKEKPKPVPPPPVKDTCNSDTTVSLGGGINITMNICEYKRICGKGDCISVEQINTVDDIFDAKVPLATTKGDGLIWAGIYKITIPGDTCLKKPANISFTLDPECYKKGKMQVYKPKGDNALEADKNIRLGQQKDKKNLKYTMPVSCDNTALVCAPVSKKNKTKFKIKTDNVEMVYVVSNCPNTIIPAVKSGKHFILNYDVINEPKLYILTKDGETLIRDIDLTKVKHGFTFSKPKGGKLYKKYKVTPKLVSASN